MNPVAGSDRSRRGDGRSGSPNRCLLDLDGPLSPPAPEDHCRAGGLARMVRGIPGPSREPSWYRGIAMDGGGTVPADAAVLHVGCHAGQQAAPAWPARPAECNDRPWMNRLPVSLCRVSAGLLLTGDVPAVDLSCTSSCTSRDGTNDGERSKDPLPAQS
jgi:hypothetical protein